MEAVKESFCAKVKARFLVAGRHALLGRCTTVQGLTGRAQTYAACSLLRDIACSGWQGDVQAGESPAQQTVVLVDFEGLRAIASGSRRCIPLRRARERSRCRQL